MTLKGYDFENMEYGFQCDGQWMPPLCQDGHRPGKMGETSPGREADAGQALTGEFDWEDDVRPEIPYSDSIIYRLHVRGFTKA